MSDKNLISYNNTNISLVGALTSKPYAFMARSWELKIFESIDIFDNLGSKRVPKHRRSTVASDHRSSGCPR